MEFHKGEEIWREVRDVYYENCRPRAYSEVGASLFWKGGDSPELQLGRMQEALSGPVLRTVDFHRPIERSEAEG
ncbi:hypothetical protein [Paraburkholderia youngii]